MSIKLVSLSETNGLALSLDGNQWASYGKMTASERREWLGSVEEGTVHYAGKLSERRKEAIEKCLKGGVELVASDNEAAVELSERMIG
ncbi:hypothetical protein [Vibrio mediterranei]|uniref:hypothetical protein n=1 Tax=Vibrio mediterranei TaxID=689 RepID=UPI002284DA8F|nr:hypothetical protein [Vibrio mediterranei]MCY9853988.1 hypothetical protein [Vibrio mediterranei]